MPISVVNNWGFVAIILCFLSLSVQNPNDCDRISRSAATISEDELLTKEISKCLESKTFVDKIPSNVDVRLPLSNRESFWIENHRILLIKSEHVYQFNGLDWSLLVKHLVIEDIHNSWLYCFTNPLELGTRVSLPNHQPYVCLCLSEKSCLLLKLFWNKKKHIKQLDNLI